MSDGPPDIEGGQANPYAAPREDSHAAQSRVRALALLFAAMYFFQGVSDPNEGLLKQPMQSLLKTWGTSATYMGVFAAVMSLPWTIKPLYGLLTDLVPIFGQRRKSYLVLMAVIATVGYATLGIVPLRQEYAGVMLALLTTATVSVAFNDVVIDAVMIETGRPLNLTGRFQAVQWAALYTASTITGYLGGYLSGHNVQFVAFWICAALSLASLLLALAAVREPPAAEVERPSFGDLWRAATSRPMLGVTLFLFLLAFNPFVQPTYLHMTKQLNFSEEFYGWTETVSSVGAIIGSVLYGLFATRLTRRGLVQLAIIGGVTSTLGYCFIFGQVSAIVVSISMGLLAMIGVLTQLDLVARTCPTRLAGTMFALVMSVSNLGQSAGQAVGGWSYDVLMEHMTPMLAFNSLVLFSAFCTALCWLVAPWVSQEPPKSDETG
jgi:MFS family permease